MIARVVVVDRLGCDRKLRAMALENQTPRASQAAS